MRASETVIEGGEFALPHASLAHVIIDCTSMVFADAVGVTTLNQVNLKLCLYTLSS